MVSQCFLFSVSIVKILKNSLGVQVLHTTVEKGHKKVVSIKNSYFFSSVSLGHIMANHFVIMKEIM